MSSDPLSTTNTRLLIVYSALAISTLGCSGIATEAQRQLPNDISSDLLEFERAFAAQILGEVWTKGIPNSREAVQAAAIGKHLLGESTLAGQIRVIDCITVFQSNYLMNQKVGLITTHLLEPDSKDTRSFFAFARVRVPHAKVPEVVVRAIVTHEGKLYTAEVVYYYISNRWVFERRQVTSL